MIYPLSLNTSVVARCQLNRPQKFFKFGIWFAVRGLKYPCSLLFCPESNWVLTKQCLPSSSEQFPCSPLNILYCLPFIISHILFCCVFTSTHFGSPAPLETGIEPVTPRLTVGCSNQLSYSSNLPYSLTVLPYRTP